MKLNLCYSCMKEKGAPGPCPHCGFDESAYEPAPHHLPPGTILYGKYLIGRVLGEGGFGITYVGWDLNLEMKVAVKEYYPNGFVSRDHERTNTLTIFTGSRGEFFQKGLEKFVDEARRLAKFWGFPGIVSVKDYFQENKTAYIVMEFVQGQTLKELLKQRPGKRLPVAEVFAMMRPVMQSLEEIHKAGLIHRDISPDNLMVSPKGQVKLIDFGAARDFAEDGEKSRSVLLKPGYAPSEQYRSRGNQGPWTDVYSLCATMYRAITGRVPEESLDRMEEDTLKRPSQLGVTIPAHQEGALMKGLAVFQRERFPSVEELEAALYAEPEEAKKPEKKLPAAHDEERKTDGAAKEQEKAGEIETAGKAGEAEKPREPAGKQETEVTEGNRPQTKVSEAEARREEMIADSSRKKRLGLVAGGAAALLVVLAICILVLRGDRDSEKAEKPMQTADAAPEADGQETVSEMDMDEPVVWTDSNMERFIRQGLGKPEGDILVGDLANIQVLRIAKTGVVLYKSLEEDEGFLAPVSYDDVEKENAITSLEDLKYFPNLTILQIRGHKVTDISALSSLTSLTELDLGSNEVVDISALSGLTSLTNLNLLDNKIMDISALSGLTSLTELHLGSNEVVDISALSGLTSLTNLNLLDNKIMDISALSGLTSLTKLYLGDNELTDIRMLSNLTSLTVLDLSINELTDISALSGLTSLTMLDLGSNELTDISVLSGLTSLIYLNLRNNELTDISMLSGLTSLTYLDLGFNKLTDISVLSTLTCLESLYLSGLDIVSLSPLNQLSNLRYLSVDKEWKGKVSYLDGIEGLLINYI